ncbi:hypothetical protein Pflav_064110 [Phytohabitans flavus]|uniref:Uncharacterized protein n=1 Tax=Phytohabitans flavus TaxID=1076124 RepID=A0A6F8Y202_9ACTN|nr:hypothetical protein Pflav_064110 [Phytohabitans flavus]
MENLRGGHDTWDFNLLIEAGEAARDLAYALRLTPVLTALSPGHLSMTLTRHFVPRQVAVLVHLGVAAD